MTGKHPPFYWERFGAGGPTVEAQIGLKLPPGQDLAALRRGAGEEPGSVPTMWPFYTQLRASGALTPELIAEHDALALFGMHQQGERTLMHLPTMSLGAACRRLRDDGRHSADAVEIRFSAAATASEVTELTWHLRGLVALLKTLKPTQGFNYTQLFWDLRDWQSPDKRSVVQRRWGAAFFTVPPSDKPTPNTTGSELE